MVSQRFSQKRVLQNNSQVVVGMNTRSLVQMRPMGSLTTRIRLFASHPQHTGKKRHAVRMICCFGSHRVQLTSLLELFVFRPWAHGLLASLDLDVCETGIEKQLLHPFGSRYNAVKFCEALDAFFEGNVWRPVGGERVVVREEDAVEFAEFEPGAGFKMAKRTLANA